VVLALTLNYAYFHRLTVFLGNSKSAGASARGVRALPDTNKRKDYGDFGLSPPGGQKRLVAVLMAVGFCEGV
jgi:hypothetical protein